MLRRQSAVLIAAIFLAPTAEAAVYKCRNAAGAVIYSEEPCEKEGAKQEKKLTRQDLKANEMRMRPKPPSGATPSYSQGSNYQGAAPDKKPSGNDRD
jgi:hypothetical protein